MTYEMNRQDDALIISVSGRLDTNTAPELQEVLDEALDDVSELTFDLDDLEYISSAGLRLLLVAQKRMTKQGSMRVCNAGEAVSEVFEMSGFDGILTLE
ncbi:MAG: STAS domain-containing protein [Atopobiaceae bacterium]|nr:STAS domain-containing protein [Atopobiaceae bacterium]